MLAAIFWFYFLWQRSAFTFPGGVRVILGPVWKYVYWPILVTTLISASATCSPSCTPAGRKSDRAFALGSTPVC